jgi:hypothetical protein
VLGVLEQVLGMLSQDVLVFKNGDVHGLIAR